MYAITFEFMDNISNIQSDSMDEFLKSSGFTRNECIYFGNGKITSVDSVLVVQRLSKKYHWFNDYVKDIRLLRIEENASLMDSLRI